MPHLSPEDKTLAGGRSRLLASAKNGLAKITAEGASWQSAARETPSGREGRARDRADG